MENTRDKYEVGPAIPIENAQTMTKEPNVTESDIYADDVIYLHLKSWNGMTVTITVADLELSRFAELGFGQFSEDSGELAWNPQGVNAEFALSFRCMTADNQYRMYQLFSFVVNEIRESNTQTKGTGGEINAYQIMGTITARKLDDFPGMIKDSETTDDLEWLDEIVTAKQGTAVVTP